MQNLTFDESNPQNIVFDGYVRLNSVNTGEPNRDGGCLLSTFSTTADATEESTNMARITSIANTGKYSTTDDGFLIDADLTFMGFTREVTVKLFYYPQSDQGSYLMTGFTAQFQFNAISDFGISSSNIDDQITVNMNILFKNKKPS